MKISSLLTSLLFLSSCIFANNDTQALQNPSGDSRVQLKETTSQLANFTFVPQNINHTGSLIGASFDIRLQSQSHFIGWMQLECDAEKEICKKYKKYLGGNMPQEKTENCLQIFTDINFTAPEGTTLKDRLNLNFFTDFRSIRTHYGVNSWTYTKNIQPIGNIYKSQFSYTTHIGEKTQDALMISEKIPGGLLARARVFGNKTAFLSNQFEACGIKTLDTVEIDTSKLGTLHNSQVFTFHIGSGEYSLKEIALKDKSANKSPAILFSNSTMSIVNDKRIQCNLSTCTVIIDSDTLKINPIMTFSIQKNPINN